MGPPLSGPVREAYNGMAVIGWFVARSGGDIADPLYPVYIYIYGFDYS